MDNSGGFTTPPPPPPPPGGEGGAGGAGLPPRGIGEILSTVFEIYKANAASLLMIVAIVVVPLTFISAFLSGVVFAPETRTEVILGQQVEVTSTSAAAALLVAAIAAVIGVIISAVLQAAIMRGAAQGSIGDQVDARARHFQGVVRGSVGYDVPWFRSSYGRFLAGLRQVELDGDRSCCDDPSVNERVSAGTFSTPPGMDQVYDVAEQSVTLVLDSRWPRSPEDLELASDYVPPPGNGVRLGMRADLVELTSQSLAAGDALASAWLHYGTSLGGYLDLTGYQRSLSATVLLDFVDPLGSGAVPITDLVSLGGERPLRGFLPGRFVDRSAAALRLEYSWPVAVWLDGELLYETGNVFGAGLAGFDLADFRSSLGFGLSAAGNQDHKFQLLLAVGTTSFRDGSELDSFRFVLGTTAGF